MIAATGFFDKSGSPSVKIKLSGVFSSETTEFDAIIDTGFTGLLAMPLMRAFLLGLRLAGTTTVVLADGNSQPKLMAMANIAFGSREEIGLVILEQSSKDILVGMDFLRTFKLAMWIGERGIMLHDEEEMDRFMATISSEPEPSRGASPQESERRVNSVQTPDDIGYEGDDNIV
jgi:predicted aspartyl protease